jgi:hypothetical protein
MLKLIKLDNIKKISLISLLVISIFIFQSSIVQTTRYIYAFKLFNHEKEVEGKDTNFKIYLGDEQLKYKHYPIVSTGTHQCFYSWLMYSSNLDFQFNNIPITIIKDSMEIKDTMLIYLRFSTEAFEYGYATHDRTLDSIIFIPGKHYLNERSGYKFWEAKK